MTVGNLTEEIGTLGADTLIGEDLEILFGLDGNDDLTASLGVFGTDETAFGVGGAGDDTFTASDNSTLVVFEEVNSGTDAVVAPNLGLNNATSELLTIEERHILIRDINTNQEVILIDALLPGTRIESFRGSDGLFTLQ